MESSAPIKRIRASQNLVNDGVPTTCRSTGIISNPLDHERDWEESSKLKFRHRNMLSFDACNIRMLYRRQSKSL
jgi:hypothetical protein